jgi:hypothetical protein
LDFPRFGWILFPYPLPPWHPHLPELDQKFIPHLAYFLFCWHYLLQNALHRSSDWVFLAWIFFRFAWIFAQTDFCLYC